MFFCFWEARCQVHCQAQQIHSVFTLKNYRSRYGYTSSQQASRAYLNPLKSLPLTCSASRFYGWITLLMNNLAVIWILVWLGCSLRPCPPVSLSDEQFLTFYAWKTLCYFERLSLITAHASIWGRENSRVVRSFVTASVTSASQHLGV